SRRRRPGRRRAAHRDRTGACRAFRYRRENAAAWLNARNLSGRKGRAAVKMVAARVIWGKLMDIYHGWFSLKPGVRDMDFVDAFTKYMDRLEAEGVIEGWRLMRKKLGLAPADLGEFHFMIEVTDLTQLDSA